MRGLGAGGNKPIKEVEELRARVAKLEQVNRKLDKHKSPDEELDKAWHEWEKTFDATKDSIMVIDSESKIIQANRATSRFLNKPLEELIGKTCWQVVHGTEKPPKECPLTKALYSKKHEEAELYIPEKAVWLEVSTDPILEDQGNINRIVHVLRDITERKKAQETLRENEERYRAIVEQAADSIVLIDGEAGELLEFNDTAYENLGYTREEFRKLKLPDFEIIESTEDVAKHIEKIIRKGKDSFETKHRTKDGCIRDVHVSSRAISIGGRDFVQSIWRDVTERKKSELQIRKERDKAQKYLDIAGVMLVATDAEQRVGLINKKGCEILGYKEEDIIGKNWFDNFLPKRIRDEVRAVFEKIVVGNAYAPEYHENPILTKDGQERLIAWHNTILEDGQGNIVAALSSGEDITERKKAEEELRKSRNLLEKTFLSLDSAIFLLDSASPPVIMDCNPAATKIFGYEKHQMLGRTTLFLHISKDTLCEFQMALYPAIEQQGFLSDFEFRMKRKNGQVFTTEHSVIPLKDDKGTITGWVSVVRDVTERKRAEEALRESENKYRELADSITDIFFAMDNNLRYTYWNKASENLTGIKAEDAIGKTIFEIFPDNEDTRKAVAVYQDVLKTQQPKSFENEYQLKGKDCFFEINAYPSKDGISVFVKDITERKKAEEALRESHDYLKKLTDSMWDAVFSVKMPERVIEWVNDSFSLTGYGTEDCIGKTTEFLYPDKSEFMDFGNKLKKSIEAGEDVLHAEQLLRRKDGEIFPAEITTTVFREKGEIVRITSIVRDITERKKAEEKLLEYQEKLKAMASKILQTEERERQNLAVGLHDDICQKLVLTKLALESSLKSISDPNLSETLRNVCVEIGEVIQEADSLTFALSTPILHEFGFVTALEKYLTEEIQKKYGIAYELQSDKQLDILHDEIKTCLFRVTRELLTNVVRHANARKVIVTVRKSRGQICVTVQDDGVGFKAAEVSSKAYKTKRFGLFSVREQLEYLGGRLEIESEPGRGTKVTIVVPQRKNAIV